MLFEALVDLQYNTLNCKTISQILSLPFDEGSQRFPPGVSYDSLSFNATALPIPSASVCHNISSSILSTPTQTSSQLIVKDTWIGSCMKRQLGYALDTA